jgi:hypothetical protein
VKELSEQEAARIGQAVRNAWTDVGYYGDVAIGRAAEQATREWHWRDRDEQWEKAIRSELSHLPVSLKSLRARLEGKPQSRIITFYIHPPIPIRHFDWVAWIDGEEESMRYGHGRSETEAKDELRKVLQGHEV